MDDNVSLYPSQPYTLYIVSAQAKGRASLYTPDIYTRNTKTCILLVVQTCVLLSGSVGVFGMGEAWLAGCVLRNVFKRIESTDVG